MNATGNEGNEEGRRNLFSLEKAVETAKYANHAKTERLEKKMDSPNGENALFDSTPFFRVFGVFRGLNCQFRFSRGDREIREIREKPVEPTALPFSPRVAVQ